MCFVLQAPNLIFLAVSPEEKESWINVLNAAITRAKNKILDEVRRRTESCMWTPDGHMSAGVQNKDGRGLKYYPGFRWSSPGLDPGSLIVHITRFGKHPEYSLAI